MAEVGLSVAVADAHPLLLPRAIMSRGLTADAARYAKSAICYYWRRASWMRPKGNQYE
jgi:hypothetical protein